MTVQSPATPSPAHLAHPPIPLYADRLRGILIGRGPHCHVNIAAQDPVTAKKISRRHALIVWDSATSSFRLCVLGLNGVIVNGAARFADDDDDQVEQEEQGGVGQGIELKKGTIMEFPGGVRFEFMGERPVPATNEIPTTTKTLVSSPMRGMSLTAARDVEVEVQGHEQVENALDAAQGLLSLASSASAASSSVQPPAMEITVSPRSSLPPSTPATSLTSSSFKPPRPLTRPTSTTAIAPTPSVRRNPLLLQLDDVPVAHVNSTMGLDPPAASPADADMDADSEFDPDQTLPAIDILSTRLTRYQSPMEPNENQPSTTAAAPKSALAPLPQTPVRSNPAPGKPTAAGAQLPDSPNQTDSDSDSLSSSSPTSPDRVDQGDNDSNTTDPHGPPPMPLLDILVESFTFCARSDLSLAELHAEICANQVYYRTHPCPARWHAQVLATLRAHNGMFALRPRNKWLKRATQWYYDPDRDHDRARAARFREFGSAQPARRAKRRAETQYYVKDMTGKPLGGGGGGGGGGASRGAGGVKIVVDENEEEEDDDDDDDDEEEGSYAKMDAGKRALGSKKPRTIRAAPDDDMVLPSSDATMPGSPVMRRYADVVEASAAGRRTRGAMATSKKEVKAKGKLEGVRLDLDD